MKYFKFFAILISASAAFEIPANAQQPPDNVVSDACFNTAMGGNALISNENGTGCATSGFNTAAGYEALYSNTTGQSNTAYGTYALHSNLGATMSDPAAGSDNTAVGLEALYSNTTGVDNTAIGLEALYLNTTGNGNTASGFAALNRNTTGTFNTASGFDALYSNTTGSNNTASGYTALNNNTTGMNNTAIGYGALFFSNIAQNNTASGYEALVANTTGSNNTAAGYEALEKNTTGSNNIAEGYQAGSNLSTGSNNIDIGNVGVAGESHAIRIGTHGTQKATFIAGIYGTAVTGSAVVVSSTGKLGVTVSSERFKTAIAPMASNTAKLQKLRPVTFKLKSDPQGALQYGLIAEEVAKVYPELVIRGERGRIDGVRYDELAPMLLNEVQQQAAEIHDLKKQIVEMRAVDQATQDALRKLQAAGEFVAQR
ncbi:MAG TPA: tail fiber domain-containing protein [Steroidobacteraceae bacterium]|nr:tail fiber domain-containing protein [Steroidobacteraceae bacterium]